MTHNIATYLLRRFGAAPALQVYGRGARERDWHVIDIVATHRRNADSQWPPPFFPGVCITWTANVIAVGWDFAERLICEQVEWPRSREHPLMIPGGRLRDRERRLDAGGPPYCDATEIIAHEIGHTAQARRMGLLYWPVGAAFTLFREGDGWTHWFENGASAQGVFGGIVPGSVCSRLRPLLVY